MSMQAPAADSGAQDALQAKLGKIEGEMNKLQDKYAKQRGELHVKKREWDTLKGLNGELMIQNEAMKIVKEVCIERLWCVCVGGLCVLCVLILASHRKTWGLKSS
jgi:hypothetical protein